LIWIAGTIMITT